MTDPKPEGIPLNMMIRAIWQKPVAVEEFKYPYLMVDFGPASKDGKYLKDGDHAVCVRTLGHHDPSDTLLHLYRSCVHPQLRSFLERTVWDALHAIQVSPDYQEAHDAWRVHKGQQPSNLHDSMIRKAQGHPSKKTA